MPRTDPDTGDASRLRSGAVTPLQALFFGLTGVGLPIILSGTGATMAMSAGMHGWIAILIATLLVVPLASIVARFARRHVVTGTLMSYVSLEAGSRAGVATGAALFVAYSAATMLIISGCLVWLTSFLAGIGVQVGGVLPHVVLGALIMALCVVLARRGVALSVKTAITMGWMGLPVILVILVAAVANYGIDLQPQFASDGFSPSPFVGGVLLAFGVYPGFEGFTALARETDDPRRWVPRLVVIMLLVMAVAALVSTVLTAPVILANSDAILGGDSPVRVLAVAGGLPALGVVGDAMLFVATVGALLVYLSNASRIIGTAAKEGNLPSALAHIDPRHGTPARATVFMGLIGALGFIGYIGVAAQPIYEAFLTFSAFLTFAWLIAYVLLAGAGVTSAIREHDGVFAAVSTIAGLGCIAILVLTLTESTATGVQAAMPWIAMAVTLVLAVIGIQRVRRRTPDAEREAL